jgi:antitoxin (DNA-binding transcriptional repressor) of toxin-antitoxin stability system
MRSSRARRWRCVAIECLHGEARHPHLGSGGAVSNFADLLTRVRAGIEVVIERGNLPVAMIHAPAPPHCTISECIALARAHEEETGEVPVLDPDFAADLEDIIKGRTC